MTDAAIGQGRFDIGRVISRTFGVMTRNFGVFFGLSLLFGALPIVALSAGWYFVWGVDAEVSDPLLARGLAISYQVVTLVFTSVLTGALVHAAVLDLNGGKSSFGASL